MAYKQHYDNEDNWIVPRMKNYKMACCDCGLVHNITFKVMRITKTIKQFRNGNKIFDAVDMGEKYVVAMKVDRNNRATGQLRRHNKKKQNLTFQL